MKIIFAGNGIRGIACLDAIKNKYNIVGVIGHKTQKNELISQAEKFGFATFQPSNINSSNFVNKIKALKADICILAGYGQIVKNNFLSITKYGCINLHAGKLPQYRGSSPMNWALINGDNEYSISIIKVDEGVDTGPVLAEKTFSISTKDTILDLHNNANIYFPKILLNVLSNIVKNKLKPLNQNESNSSYYPLRFPEDGIVFFDQFSAEEIHNRIRALTDPYPGVLCYFKDRKIKILSSQLTQRPFFGEPGRIYRVSKKGLLVCAKDRCLWLTKVIDIKTGKDLSIKIKRYDSIATIKGMAIKYYENK